MSRARKRCIYRGDMFIHLFLTSFYRYVYTSLFDISLEICLYICLRKKCVEICLLKKEMHIQRRYVSVHLFTDMSIHLFLTSL